MGVSSHAREPTSPPAHDGATDSGLEVGTERHDDVSHVLTAVGHLHHSAFHAERLHDALPSVNEAIVVSATITWVVFWPNSSAFPPLM